MSKKVNPRKEPYRLTAAERQLLEAGSENPNLLTGYFCRKPGEELGWQFDANFSPDGAWQLDACMANQTLQVIVGGVGCSDIDSRIYDAELQRYITIRELITKKRAPVVLARTNNGWRRVRASRPYFKGTGKMVRVHLSDGNVVDVSVDHRFLMPGGDYIPARDLRVGNSLVAPRRGVKTMKKFKVAKNRPVFVMHNAPGLPKRFRHAGLALQRPQIPDLALDILDDEILDVDVSCFFDEDRGEISWRYDDVGVGLLDTEGIVSFDDCDKPIVLSIAHLGERDLYDIHVPIWNNYVMDGVVSHNTGKTIGIAAGAIVWALTTPDFKFLNIGKELHQAKYVYKEIANFCQGTYLGKLVWTMRESPTPYIEFRFYVGERLMRSTFEFFGLGDDADAMNIFSWRGDWINIEECGRIDNLAEIAGNLQTRLTGAINGRSYLGRLSMISNPIDNADMWNLFDLALKRPEKVLSISVSTLHNKNVSEEQVESMRLVVPDGKQEAYILGARTEPEGGFYDRATVAACGSDAMSELIKTSHDSGAVGYTIVEAANLGWVHFETPRAQDREYAVFGDPGILGPPARNAPVLSVWDITNQSAARLVAFWWGNGGGRIEPFVEKLLHFIKKYHPLMAGIDSTATQKYLAEMLTTDRISGEGLSVESILPMDFSGNKKMGLLAALRMAMEDKKLLWPSMVKGTRQITGYDPIRDTANSKLPQDVVSCFAMAAFGIRRYWSGLSDDDGQGSEKSEPLDIDSGGIIRRERDSAPVSRWYSGARTKR